MATYEIPKSAGTKFWSIPSRAGTPVVTNGKTGKDKVFIPCKDTKQAEKLIQMLESEDHTGLVYA